MKGEHRMENKKVNIVKHMQERLHTGVNGYEIVIVLVAMVKAGQLAESRLKSMLLEIFSGDILSMVKALNIARNLIDEQLIDAVIAG
jgi:hypothetical protein